MRSRRIKKPFSLERSIEKDLLRVKIEKHSEFVKLDRRERQFAKFSHTANSVEKEIAEIESLLPNLQSEMAQIADANLKMELSARFEALTLRLASLKSRAPEYHQSKRDEMQAEIEMLKQRQVRYEATLALISAQLEAAKR